MSPEARDRTSGWGARALAAAVGLGALASGSLGSAWIWGLALVGLAWLALRPGPRAAWGDPGFVFGLGLALALGLLGLLAWWECSALIGGRRWWWLEDDAMVSMRYGARLAQGLGLTWTAGPRVEGYSNLLWTLGMALVHALGAGPATASAWVLGAAGLCLAWFGTATRALARALGAGPLEAALAGAAAVLSYDALAGALSGMETLAVAAVATQALAWTAAARDRGGAVRALALAACLPLLRADGLLPALLVLGLAWRALPGPRDRWGGAALVLGPALLHLAWRHAYYGAWVPNTYVLKAGWWPGKGAAAVRMVAADCGRYPLVGLACLAALFRPVLRPYVLAAAALLAYTVWGGADYFPFLRFFAPGWGLAFALAFAALGAWPRLEGVRVPLAWALFLAGFNALLALPNLAQAGWPEARERLEVALDLRGRVAPSEKLASAWAGTFFYFSGAQGVDLLGKCDPVVAASPPSLGLEGVGHNKLDLEWSLGVLRPRWVLVEIPAYSATDGAYVISQYDQRIAAHPLFLGHCRAGMRQVSDHWALCDCAWGPPGPPGHDGKGTP